LLFELVKGHSWILKTQLKCRAKAHGCKDIPNVPQNRGFGFYASSSKPGKIGPNLTNLKKIF